LKEKQIERLKIQAFYLNVYRKKDEDIAKFKLNQFKYQRVD